jgi:hypothetical protein
MATILEFRRAEEAAGHTGKPVEGSLGEIIIFLGVRIDRLMSRDEPQDTGSTSGRKSARARKKSRV